MSPRSRTLVSGASVLLLAAGAFQAVSPASAAGRATVFSQDRPAWVARARSLGAVRGSTKVNARVYLAPQGGEAALEAAVKAVSTPGTAQYGHYLTHAQYLARYAPTTGAVRTVSDHLRAAGLTVSSVGTDRAWVQVTGTARAAKAAFGTRIDWFRHNGVKVQAPTSAVKVGGESGRLVSSVTGLDTTPIKATPSDATPVPPAAGYRNVTPGCSDYYGQNTSDQAAFQGKKLPTILCGYNGWQLRSAYLGRRLADGWWSGQLGRGVTVAVIDAYASPTIASDITKYAAQQGDDAYRPGQFTQNTLPASQYTDTGDDACGASGWYGEETLDVEAVHALAQGANIRFYAASACYDSELMDAFYRVLNEDRASIITNSYGTPELEEDAATTTAWHNAFLQAAMQGMSVMASSGDDGDEVASAGSKQTDSPASDPLVTAVGGTAIDIDGNGRLVAQTGWGTDKWKLSADGSSWTSGAYLYGSGGGYSAVWNRPWYQQSLSSTTTGRAVPDVSMVGDPSTGFLVGQTQTFTDGTYYDVARYGGTSLSSPLLAAMTAIKIANTGGWRLGFLNPSLYRSRRQITDVSGSLPDAGVVRKDFTNGENAAGGYTYSVRTFNQDSSLTVTPGWDDVTGLGSPNLWWTLRR